MTRICSHVLAFNQDRFLPLHIEMIGGYVEKIYLAYSDMPWDGYNPTARNQFKNNFNPDSLKNCKYYDKIIFIKGEWHLDEDQRNSCLNAAKSDGFTHMLIVDADEFYEIQALKYMINTIQENPNYDVYQTPWISYWKDLQHIVVNQENSPIIGYPEVCVNLTTGVKFVRCRRPNANTSLKLNSLCHHLSYVLNDKQCWEKIQTWGHSHQFNKDQWYRDKWLNWNENTQNLHPVNPDCWKKAIISTFELPEILKKL